MLELQDLKIRLALGYYNIGTKRGILDRNALNWINDKLSTYDGSIIEGELKLFLKNMSKWNDETLTAALRQLLRSRKRFVLALGSIIS